MYKRAVLDIPTNQYLVLSGFRYRKPMTNTRYIHRHSWTLIIVDTEQFYEIFIPRYYSKVIEYYWRFVTNAINMMIYYLRSIIELQ